MDSLAPILKRSQHVLDDSYRDWFGEMTVFVKVPLAWNFNESIQENTIQVTSAFYFHYILMCMCTQACIQCSTCGSQRKTFRWFFYHLGPGVQTWVVWLGSKYPYLLSHIIGPFCFEYVSHIPGCPETVYLRMTLNS